MSHFFKCIASALVFIIFQTPAASFSQQGAPAPNRSVILVNGGMEPGYNYITHDEELSEFANLIFGRNLMILDAGGPAVSSVQIDDHSFIVRDSTGLSVPTGSDPNYIQGAQHYSTVASKENVVRAFKTASGQNRDEVLSVWVDHGGKEGQSLWFGDVASSQDISKMYDLFPPATLKRSIFLSCEAGNTLVDQSQKPPAFGDSLTSFMLKKYSPNRCGLAISDEVTLSDSNQAATLIDALDEVPTISLNGLKRVAFNKEVPYPSHVMLTSDYFLRDVMDSVCSAKPKEDSSAFCFTCWMKSVNTPHTNQDQLNDIKASMLHNLCSSPNTSDANTAEDVFHFEGEVGTFLYELREKCKLDYFKEKDPAHYKEFFDNASEVSKLRKKALTEDRSLAADDDARASRLWLQNQKSSEFVENFFHAPTQDFEKYFDNVCLQSNKVILLKIYGMFASYKKKYPRKQKARDFVFSKISPTMQKCLDETEQGWGMITDWERDFSEFVKQDSSLSVKCGSLGATKGALENHGSRLGKYLASKLPVPQDGDWTDLYDSLYAVSETNIRAAVRNYNDASSKQRKEREDILNGFLDSNPALKPIKDRYENIRKCEDKPIN